MATRNPYPFAFALSPGGYKVSGTIPGRRLDVYRHGDWCGSITLERGQVAEVSVSVPKHSPPFPREEAVKALRRILGTSDESSQIDAGS